MENIEFLLYKEQARLFKRSFKFINVLYNKHHIIFTDDVSEKTFKEILEMTKDIIDLKNKI